jgi:dTDP-4-dehydrorhamnose 3,5-epimerase
MKATPTRIPDVLLIEPKVFGDDRGFFFEVSTGAPSMATGLNVDFVQDNHSKSLATSCAACIISWRSRRASWCASRRARCLTWRSISARARRLTVSGWARSVGGEQETTVDSRRAGAWFRRALETAEFLYKTTDYYAPQHERCIAWNDPDLAIAWPIEGQPLLSAKDAAGIAFREAE